jgi:predicted metal-dependent hydrolase
MTIDSHSLTVSGISVEIVRKDIKNLHLGVYPPEGRVRVAAPLLVNDEAVRLAVIGKLAWIKRQQAKFAAQSRQSARQMVSGESHYFQGQRYRLRVIESSGRQQVCLRGKATLELCVRPGSTVEQREAVLRQWYRDQLRLQAAGLLEQWQAVLGVEAGAWGIRRMKTQWGSCNTESRRLWLNLELAKKPPPCVEYIVVHELMHLRERHHNARFVSLMTQYLPNWELTRALLNQSPLAREEWN